MFDTNQKIMQPLIFHKNGEGCVSVILNNIYQQLFLNQTQFVFQFGRMSSPRCFFQVFHFNMDVWPAADTLSGSIWTAAYFSYSA